MKTYAPESLVTLSRRTFVSTFLKTTRAPGKDAPVGSVTLPFTEEEELCALARVALTRRMAPQNTARTFLRDDVRRLSAAMACIGMPRYLGIDLL